jgi:hypothetical protein
MRERTKRNSPKKGIPQELSLGDLRNGDNDSPRKQNRVSGEREISLNGGPEKKGNKKGNAQPRLNRGSDLGYEILTTFGFGIP